MALLSSPRLAGAERARARRRAVAQQSFVVGMRAAEHAPRGPFYLLQRRYRLAEIVERGVGVSVEGIRINRPSP